jgi:FMN hydrolase / 5-amino-6-(5-phospho-D-ribitylamino)uracil phosphatase
MIGRLVGHGILLHGLTFAAVSPEDSGMNAPRPTPIRPAPDLALFDLDDTLCDYAAARSLRLRTAFSLGAQEVGLPDGALDLDAMITESIAIHPHGADHFVEVFTGRGVDPRAGDIAREWYVSNRFHGLALFADAVETLQAVRAARAGRRIGLVTNGPTSVQRAKIDLLGVAAHVDFILVSEEVGIWKPEPGIFTEALRQGGASPREAVFVGDSAEHDMAGAVASGIRAVWIERGGRAWPGPGPAPDHVVPDLAAVRALLGGG